MTHSDSINPAIKAIDERIELLAKELEDLRLAKKVLEGLTGVSAQITRTLRPMTHELTASQASSVTSSTTFYDRLTSAPKDKGSNKDLFVAILKRSAQPWLTANEIQEIVSVERGAEVPMSTVSPTLSDMKRKGLIVRNGFKVALTDRVASTGTDRSVGWGSQNRDLPTEEMFEEP